MTTFTHIYKDLSWEIDTSSKIITIKAARATFGISLREARDLTDKVWTLLVILADDPLNPTGVAELNRAIGHHAKIITQKYALENKIRAALINEVIGVDELFSIIKNHLLHYKNQK